MNNSAGEPEEMSRRPGGWTSRPDAWIFAMIIAGAGALRLAASRGDFWIDEIFSWRIARRVAGPIGIFTRVHSDNNHYLNTLWMYLAGDVWHWQIYRAPAVICGTVSVALLAALARANGRAASVIAAVLAGASYFLVQYSSEARGYAPAMMFALVCIGLMRWYLERPRRGISLAFGGFAILGMLSHLTFVYIYAGLAAWSLIEIARDGALKRERLRHLVRLHAVPATFLAVFYFIEIAQMHTAGGPVYRAWRVVADTFAWTIGGPRRGIGLWMGIGAVIGICTCGIITMARRGQREWIFYLISLAIAPAAVLLLWRPTYLYPRYFFLCAPLVYLLLARFLGRWWERGGARRAVCALAVALFLAGNAVRLNAFFTRGGRGQYLQAMRFILERSGGSATVGSTQDSRNTATFAFYRKHLPAGTTLQYIPRDHWSAAPPDWMIIDGIEGIQPTSDHYTTDAGIRYRLVKTFGYSGLSGFDWYVLRMDREKTGPITTSTRRSTTTIP